MDSEDFLTSFRQEWKRELEKSSHRAGPANGNQAPDKENAALANSQFCSATSSGSSEEHSDIEAKAASLFTQGVKLEQSGQLYESIRYYRKAISLVPDIELRVHQNAQESDSDSSGEELDEEEDTVVEDLDCSDLVARFESLVCANQPVCQPCHPQDAPHLSCLPVEMLDRILCWVVGSELDFESLENLSAVCRGLFLQCRKPDIWRRACLRVWGMGAKESCYGSWREMFLTKPRPRFDGTYISRVNYFRSGENSFQDMNYQPWYIVSYYRYLRFFANGQVLMLTSSEDPQTVVGHLRKLDSRHPQVLRGHFRIHGSSVTMLFRKTSGKVNNRFRGRRRAHGTTDVSDTTFQMEMEVKAVRRRPNWQLSWRCYSVVSSYRSGSHTTSVVNVADQTNFPPLNFSKVRSYTAESDAPLV